MILSICENHCLGDIAISNITFTPDSDLNGASPQFTLTCISTGGPATTVTWTRDSDTVIEGNETVLNNRVTAQYTHTLTVTGRLGGLYKCVVTNNKPSQNSTTFAVYGIYTYSFVMLFTLTCFLPAVASAPTNLMAVQEGLTSIRVSWTISSDVSGYRISYNSSSDDSQESVTISDGSNNAILLNSLIMKANYTISVVATSPHFHSSTIEDHVTLIKTQTAPIKL